MPLALRRILEGACLWFAGLGLSVALAGESALFAPWRAAAAEALFGRASLPATLSPALPVTFGILGGSIFGKWMAAWLLVRGPLDRGERWAWRALVAGLGSWWLVDTGVSIARGAVFNAWMINLAPLLVFGVPLLLARRHTRLDESWPELRPVERALVWICAAFALFGIVVAVGSTSAIFAVYRQGMADAFFGGALPPEAITWIAFLYAPIGATFLGHFTMLAWAVMRDRNRAEARWIVAVSMLAWFLVDSSTGMMHGAWFNIAMVNVPSLLAVGVPWWLARPRSRHPS